MKGGFALKMTLSLYNYYGKDIIQNVLHWRPDEPQWWITGFNPRLGDPKVEEMVSVGTIDFDGRTGMFESLKKKTELDTDLKDFMIFDEDNHTVWLMWWEGQYE